ncbi:MAG: hypothetical protein IT359_11380 [Gemmatimonadaceae bacterium]|nr:hypothetical protein [Gemmatimonadaceae bacterium]
MRLVLIVPSASDAGDDPEVHSVAAWVAASGWPWAVQRLDESRPGALGDDDVAWCHAGQAVPTLPSAWRDALSSWIAGGGGLLLTALATPLAGALGAPDESPQLQRIAAWRHADDPLWDEGFRDWPDYPHIRGAQGWGRHPLFDGLPRGTFTWRAREGEGVARTVFRAPHWPRGRVIAVDRAYVRLDADTAVAWEYDVGNGRILCLGANVALAARDQQFAAQRDRYLHNAIASLDRARRRAEGRAEGCAQGRSGRGAGGWRSSWPRRGAPAVAMCDGGGVPALPPAATRLSSVLEMEGDAREGAPFTVAGRRTLVVGDEANGSREWWMHPLCVLSEGLRLTVDGAPLTATRVRVTPGGVERTLRDANARAWREVVATDAARAIIHLDIAPLDATAGGVLVLEGALRLRLQWPFPGQALQPLAMSVQRAEEGRYCVSVAAVERRAGLRLAVAGAAEVTASEDEAAPALRVVGHAGRGLRLAAVASAGSDARLQAEWAALAQRPLDVVLEDRSRRDAERRQATVRLTTPSVAFDAAWEWAKARLAACVVDVPGIGSGFVAGYAASRPGWGDSRPGYAWFFGRDACWCGDALLAAGMFGEARIALEFLAATADVTGKIVHEVTTSGVVHYDAADSTPLWLRFVSAYAEWTGDLATVRALWDHVRAAFDRVVATDRDGDGLPENVGVGHGWVESGPLGGGAVTSYVAAIWIDALRRLAPLASLVGDHQFFDRIADAQARATGAFESRLRDAATGRVVLQLSDDGSAAADLTALSAVPVLLGVDDTAGGDAVVRALASSDFATPWGVRMIPASDARYRPRGYHCGAVWPLYTGWASLASYRRGDARAGWQHLASVAACAFLRERGAFDEVLDGDTGAAAGICPDQAWSAAMAIAPFMHGMLGIQPMASARGCTLAPQWPPEWRAARVDGVRVGASRFSIAMRRAPGEETVEYTLQRESGDAIAVALAHADGVATVMLDNDAPHVITVSHAGGPDGRR